MKALTASLLTLGIAAAGIATTTAHGDHGQPGTTTTQPGAPSVETTPRPSPLTLTSPSPRTTGTSACQGPVCTLPRRTACRATPEQFAANLHLAAATLADDIDFDLYGICDFAHLIRDAGIVVRDAVTIRRDLARRVSRDALLSDVRNAECSLRHLERSIGRRYRTRAIHFGLLDARAALNELTVSLGDGPQSGIAPLESGRSDLQLQHTDPQQPQSPGVQSVPWSSTPPVPPAFGTGPPAQQPERTPLVIPGPGDAPVIPESMHGIRELSQPDQRLAIQQRTCPVTGDLLGSMGQPIKVNVNGRSVFVCCQGCVAEVQSGTGLQ